jgi:alpha-galactosidase
MPLSLLSLDTSEASLVLETGATGTPLWRHLGARVDAGELFALADSRTPASFSLDLDVPAAVLPPAGLGWFGLPALALRRGGQACVAVFDDVAVEHVGEVLTITARDAVAGVEVVQRITAGAGFTLSTTLRNTGTQPLDVDWLASALIPLSAHAASLISWRGRHNAELVECAEPLPQQAWLREGRRGISGHGGPPGLFVLDEGAGHHAGLVFGLQLAWSGDSRLAVERDDEGCCYLAAGAVLAPGEVALQPGECFAAPDALLAVSTTGRNGAMAQFHAMVRARMAWPGGAMRPRAVHLNSWEACYFDHDADRIVALAEAAAQVGAERFILDDGWFKGRNDDTAGLGDWTCDPVKYPQGLDNLAQRVTALGMEFGLWVEPEMINPDSDLYRAHPDWALHLPGRAQPTARNQLVLDMRRSDVREYLFGALDALLRELPIAYLKWDHNRDLAPAGGARQVQGTYDLLARLRAAHPTVEIESCAGGGGRSDAGMSAFTHRFWTSDNIDAVSRVPMQRGFLSFLPPEVMGSHVGASPAHATGRSQSMGFRAAVAMPGHFGVELDPRKLGEDDRAELADWIAFHQQWRDVLHGGQVWLGEAADGLVWQAQGTAQEFLLFAIRSAPAQDRRPQPLRLPFLAGAGPCTLRLLRIAGGAGGHAAHSAPLFDAMAGEGVSFSGSWLAHAGVPLPPLKAETVAIFHALTR